MGESAEALGLLHGDELVGVQGKSVKGQSFAEVKQAMVEAGRPLTLTVMRHPEETSDVSDSIGDF